jgi:hypothetical protein
MSKRRLQPRSITQPALLLTGSICWALLATVAGGQTSVRQVDACPGAHAHAFDFWIGDWDIRQRILRQDGTWLELPARTSVSPTLEGCALIEHWQGRVMFFWEGMREPQPMTGLSVRAYDPRTAKWYIHWMDTRAPRFGDPYVGDFEDGQGEFFREWQTPEGERMGRITFSDIATNTVNWALAISSDGGRSWQTIWTMEMQRQPGGKD